MVSKTDLEDGSLLITTNHNVKIETQRGFTLVELMVALVIAGIVISAGVPAIQGLFNNMASRSNADQLAAALIFARQTAVSRGQIVTICSSVDGEDCADADDQWDQGWVIFVNPDQDNDVDADADELLRSANISSSNGRTATTPGLELIHFNARGESSSDVSLFFFVCGKDLEIKAARVIQVANSGSVTTRSGAACN